MTHIVYAAVKAIIIHDGKFLVIKQQLPTRTVRDFPGGRVKHGESPYETLAREANEEVWLTVTINSPHRPFWFIRDDGDQVVAMTFLCSLGGDNTINLTNNIPDEDEHISEHRRVTAQEFLSDNYNVSNESLKEVIRKL